MCEQDHLVQGLIQWQHITINSNILDNNKLFSDFKYKVGFKILILHTVMKVKEHLEYVGKY